MFRLKVNMSTVSNDHGLYTFECPQCGGVVQVDQINCQIFRHGVYKASNTPIPPHSTRVVCDSLLASGVIWGCGRPFLFDGRVATATDQYN